jgi:ATPase components of ABC transporters with duplicated ATPase domains
LDIDSREVLETAINEFDGTVLFISHDRYFLNQVATDILYMTTHGMTHYEGNYDDYLTQQAKLEHQTQPEAKPNSQPVSFPISKAKKLSVPDASCSGRSIN